MSARPSGRCQLLSAISRTTTAIRFYWIDPRNESKPILQLALIDLGAQSANLVRQWTHGPVRCRRLLRQPPRSARAKVNRRIRMFMPTTSPVLRPSPAHESRISSLSPLGSAPLRAEFERLQQLTWGERSNSVVRLPVELAHGRPQNPMTCPTDPRNVGTPAWSTGRIRGAAEPVVSFAVANVAKIAARGAQHSRAAVP